MTLTLKTFIWLDHLVLQYGFPVVVLIRFPLLIRHLSSPLFSFFFADDLGKWTACKTTFFCSGCFHRGKRAAIVRRYPAVVFVPDWLFSCFYTTGCEAYFFFFTTDGYGICNVRTHLGACRAHEGEGWGGVGVRHKQVYTRVDSEWQKKNPPIPHPAPPGDRTNPGSSDKNSDSLTTEPRLQNTTQRTSAGSNYTCIYSNSI